MSTEVFNIDLEFEKWCDRLLATGEIDPLQYLTIFRKGGFVWEACRQKCADLCVQNGQMGTAMQIMRNVDGSIDGSWMESHSDSKE